MFFSPDPGNLLNRIIRDWPRCSEPFPVGEHAKWRCDTPPQKGYLSDTCTILCDTISKGIVRYGGYLALGRQVHVLSVYARDILGECILNSLTKMTLPKLLAN